VEKLIEKREEVNVEDVERVDKLFMDVGEAAEHLKKYEEKMMLHRVKQVLISYRPSEINLKSIAVVLTLYLCNGSERHQVEENGKTQRIPAINQTVKLLDDGFCGDCGSFAGFRP